MIAPTFAIVLSRPLVWLVARGVLRDVQLASDPSMLLGQPVALFCSDPGGGDERGRLEHLLAGTGLEGATAAQVEAEAPHQHLVGVAWLDRVATAVDGWMVHLAEARPLVVPVPVQCVEGVELLGLPLAARAVLATQSRAWFKRTASGSGRP